MSQLSRRQFTASASVALGGWASAGLSACSSDAGPQGYEALVAQTWRLNDTVVRDGEPRAPKELHRELIRLATLAPSSHNTQCWRFALEDGAVWILPDMSRRCPAVDPDDHHLFVSLGCACENLVQAAQAHGLNATARFDAERNAIRVALEPAATPFQPSSLFKAIAERQCTRGDYDGKPLSRDELRLLEQAGNVVSKQELIARVWPKSVVEDGNLRVHMAALRKALGDGQAGQRYIVTVAQREDTHGYSTSKGIPRLRRAISNWYKDRYEVDIDPETEAIVTIGSKEGLAHLMLATLDHGDTVLVPNPSYPIHIYGAVIAGAQVRSVPLIPGVDFFAELERAIRESIPKPKMMILGFPSNPTAQCVELDFFERVVALAKQYDVLVIHDLAYADIVYDGWKAPSIMQVPGAKDIAVEFFTLSKSYNMAGWRIGFMVGNKELVNALARIKSYHDYGTFTPLQVAAIAALEGDQQCVRDIAEQYRQRRNVLVKGLHEIGWMVENPKASMYVWAKIPEQYAHLGSLEFAKKLLLEAKVCVSPGIGFGDYGDDHVRFAMIENQDRTRQAIRGIKAMFRADGLIQPPAAGKPRKAADS